MMALGIMLVIGQAIVTGLLIRFIRTFGSYTETLRKIHDSNLVIVSHQEAMTDDIARAIDKLDTLNKGRVA